MEGSRLDIRLPSVSPNLRARRDIRKAVVGVGVGMGAPSPGEEVQSSGTSGTALNTSPVCPTSDEDSDENDGEGKSVIGGARACVCLCV